ncbi:MAG: reverse transcriptase/maturase family protein [bacterium]|nr:reverse transcriptase/maturase family protein [bacterium]
MKIQLRHTFEDIISMENLLEAWKEFVKGKRGKKDVQEFSLRLIDNILSLRRDLANGTYKHGGYRAFNISDPKPRSIHKATVRDRLLHHAIYRILYSFFDKTFISDSFSCRKDKGTHRALNRFRGFAYKVSQNNIRTCWVLKCDIRRFFDNIDHKILIQVLETYIPDKNIMWLLKNVIDSFSKNTLGIGLPLGNLTSQLFVNIYMNEFDQFVKYKLKEKYYLRYADDFVLLSESRNSLKQQVEPVRNFLYEKLGLELHPQKLFIKTFASGVDFLGWVHFFGHRTLRTTTRRRMMKKLEASQNPQTLSSYLGLLCYGNTRKLQREVLKQYFCE